MNIHEGNGYKVNAMDVRFVSCCFFNEYDGTTVGLQLSEHGPRCVRTTEKFGLTGNGQQIFRVCTCYYWILGVRLCGD